MHIKRYEAVNMREAMTRIKKELGPDAVILSTKKLSDAGPLIEVMAAREREAVKPVDDHPPSLHDPVRDDGGIAGLQQEIRDLKACIHGLASQFMSKSDLFGLKETLNVFCDSVSARDDAHLQNLYRILIANGFSRMRALRLTETIKHDFPCKAIDSLEKAVFLAEQLIAGSLPKNEDSEKRIQALVGPSGVGKTTTLAKLAAQYAIEKKKKVGLITTDTYRIAASEQLKVYAKIMGIPLDIAPDRDKFLQSLRQFSDKDVILVDTPGRSPQDKDSLSTLKSILAGDTETFLLLSPLATREYLMETADRFRILDYSRIILTKIDECTLLGSVMDVLDMAAKPVSHLTTGQNVPRDIERAHPERLARMTLQNRLH